MPRKRAVAVPAALYAPRDTRASAAERRREKRAEKKDKAYLAWLAQFPCVVCGEKGELHHEPPRSHAGVWHDRKTVPLCPEHHRGATGRHALGYAGFCARWGVDLRERIEHYQRLYEPEF
jgi:hypothetical protein